MLYAAIGILTVGWHSVTHIQSVCACSASADAGLFMWGLAWWPHAIANGINPFVPHYVWSPVGSNIAQATMIPTASIVMTPITELFGPVASYNVLSIASPVLAAFTGYLLCRRVAHREAPALVGGYIFGFGSYEFTQLIGHLNLTLIFIIPLFVYLVLCRADREISRRVYVLAMALLMILQAGLSTELLAECVGLGAVLLVSARFLGSPVRRPQLDSVIGETVGAGLIALVLASPFFYYAFFSGGFPSGAPFLSDAYALDLLNPLLPTYSTWLGHSDLLAVSSSYVGGGVGGTDGYLSIPIIIAFGLYVLGRHKTTLAKLLMIATGVSFIAALGSHLYVDGHRTIPMPFDLVRHLPIFNNVIPERIILFTTLAVAVGIATWLSFTTGRVTMRWLLVLLGIILTLPNIASVLYGRPIRNPPFFATSMYKRYLTRGEGVLILPYSYNDQSMLWQAETGFAFYMPEGYVGPAIPTSFTSQPAVDQLIANDMPSSTELSAFLHKYNIHHVIVDPESAGPWSKQMAQIGLRSQRLARQQPWPERLAQLGLREQKVGGILLYNLP